MLIGSENIMSLGEGIARLAWLFGCGYAAYHCFMLAVVVAPWPGVAWFGGFLICMRLTHFALED